MIKTLASPLSNIEFYDLPSDEPGVIELMKGLRTAFQPILTIGVTGTKGKTSTVEFIAQLIGGQGFSTAVLTSVGMRIGSERYPPRRDLMDVWYFLSGCVRKAVQCVVIELTSHALLVGVHRCIDVDFAVFSNVGKDHIRAHGNARNYRRAKSRLFWDLDSQGGLRKKWAILNADDEASGEIEESLPKGVAVAAYGIDQKLEGERTKLRVYASDIRYDFRGTSYRISGLGKRDYICRTPLVGKFNVYNSMAALACAIAVNGDVCQNIRNAETLRPPSGRFQFIGFPSPRTPTVITDYAHTPESLGSVLQTAREIASRGRVIAVFGCGGDTYKAKRPTMGQIAARLADAVVLTTDNPRFEDPAVIARQIYRGIPENGRFKVTMELDRSRAIQTAIQIARPGDIVMLIGRGAEEKQEIRGQEIFFSDIDAAKASLRTYGRSKKGARSLPGQEAEGVDRKGVGSEGKSRP